MPKKSLSPELRNVIVWLERQPEVTSVVQGRYTRVKHKHFAGFTRIITSDKKSVHLRAFDDRGTKELHVWAPQSPLRDRWVAAVASGNAFTDDGKGIKLADAPTPPPFKTSTTTNVVMPKALNDHAGQLFNVTPQLASTWLEKNTRNRALREDVVQRYAADMKSGRWMITGDAIAFDKNGVVVNGQHRLWAVIFAEMTVPMLVTFNLEPEVVRVLDDHLKRKLTDIIRIAKPGTTINSKMTAVARVMQVGSIFLVAADKRATVSRLTRQQQMQFLEQHEDAISFTVRECFKSATAKGLTTASMMGVVARAYYSQDHERLKQFGKVLVSGIPENARDDVAALLLRNWLLTNVNQSLRTAGEVVYRKTERALAAFCKREHLRTLYEASTEQFYLPHEKAPKKGKGAAA